MSTSPEPSSPSPSQAPSPAAGTRWQITSSAGFDALLLLGAAAGDIMQAERYADEIGWASRRLSETGRSALAALDQGLRVESGHLTGPTLVHAFSARPADSLADVITSAEDPDGLLHAALESSTYWGSDAMPSADRTRDLIPAVATVLREFDAAGFSEWWSDNFLAAIDASVARNREALTPFDLIPEQSHLLGRALDPQIDVVITHFAKPYGIRVTGQRFIAHHEYEPQTQLRNAAHEMFHPPFDLSAQQLWQRLEPLGSDPWMASVVTNHDPKYGYNSFHGIVDEDSTQALDQVVSERLGIAYEPATRWATFDGGMHVLAAALYHALKEDGFDARGGVYGDWLTDALDRELLSPPEVRRRAADVVGDEAVSRWDPERWA